MNVYLLKNFNNYYNRKIKFYSTIDDYEDYFIDVTGEGSGYTSYNFNPNDGVNTSITIGKGEWIDIPDYCIVQNPTTNEIDSRWYVIECDRTRGGQYNLTLRRDLLADYWTNVINADTYIEKATINDDSVFIYNNEQLSVNQIKTSQTELKDNSNSAWLVGYLSSKQDSDITITASKPIDYNISVANINQWEYYKYSNLASSSEKETAYTQLSNAVLHLQIANQPQGVVNTQIFNYYLTGAGRPYISNTYVYDGSKVELYFAEGSTNYSEIMYEIAAQLKHTSIVNLAKNQYNYFDYYIVFNEINGKVIYDQASGKYYQVSVVSVDTDALNYKPTVGSQQDLDLVNYTLGEVVAVDYQNKADAFLPSKAVRRSQRLGTDATTSFEVTLTVKDLRISLEEVFEATSSITIPQGSKPLKDAPYKMFCMPYKTDGEFTFIRNRLSFTMNKDTSMAIMTKLISELSGGSVLYDAQILPYCPCKEYINQLNQFSFDTLISGELPEENVDYVLVKSEDQVVQGFIVFCDKAQFDAVVNETIQIDNVKISNECDKYRLCSPNFNGAFEFNAAKNGGVQGFNVTCTYRPYSPYIKVAPSFGNLYGDNFKDPRGLICGGDFGLPLLNDKWATYEINNKNYLNSFNRQIENMEVQQKYQRVGDIVGSITGTISGAATGALSGAMMGGGVGAIAGGVVGGVTSAAGGVADILINEQLRTEAIDYTKDQFNYSLQNIQALPYTLSRVSSLTADNTIFPVLEYYTCKEEEKEAFANKIAYNGMTLMCIGKIKDYINNTWSYNNKIFSKGYVKGQLIRIDETGINEEFHLVKEISNELYKGVYIEQWA